MKGNIFKGKGSSKLLTALAVSLFILASIIVAAALTGYRYNILSHQIDRPGDSYIKDIGSVSLTESGNYIASYVVKATFYPDLSIPLIYNPKKTVSKVNDFETLKNDIIISVDNPSRKDFQRAIISSNGVLKNEGHISEKVDIETLMQSIADNSYNGNFDLTDYYLESDTEQLQLMRDFSDKIQNWSVSYTNGKTISFNDVDFIVSAKANSAESEDELMKALDVNEELKASAKKKINSYDTSGSLSFNFVNHKGEEITVQGGTWGDVVNSEEERNAIKNLARNLTSEESRKPIMKVEMDNHNLPDTYIEVDKSEQRVYYYVSGNCTVSSDCVTGKSGKRETPSGTFYVTEKKKEKDLKGADYVSHVHRWLRLTWTGVGLHDATWRSRFGGNIWRTSGSHGCINLPKSFAYELYDMVEDGTCVVVY